MVDIGLSSDELRRRLTNWCGRNKSTSAERRARLAACLERADLQQLFEEALADGQRRRTERSQQAQQAQLAQQASEVERRARRVRDASAAAADDRRPLLRDVHGALVYLDVSTSQLSVHENDCYWPHELEAQQRARALRRHTTHRIRNARNPERAHCLRSCGFQLFRDHDVPLAPPPQRAGKRVEMET